MDQHKRRPLFALTMYVKHRSEQIFLPIQMPRHRVLHVRHAHHDPHVRHHHHGRHDHPRHRGNRDVRGRRRLLEQLARYRRLLNP